MKSVMREKLLNFLNLHGWLNEHELNLHHPIKDLKKKGSKFALFLLSFNHYLLLIKSYFPLRSGTIPSQSFLLLSSYMELSILLKKSSIESRLLSYVL